MRNAGACLCLLVSLGLTAADSPDESGGAALDAGDQATVQVQAHAAGVAAAMADGKAFEDAGRFHKALECYRRALIGAPDQVEVRTAVQRMEMALNARSVPSLHDGKTRVIKEQLARIEIRLLLQRVDKLATEARFEQAREQAAAAAAMLQNYPDGDQYAQYEEAVALIERLHARRREERLGAIRQSRQDDLEVAYDRMNRDRKLEGNVFDTRLRRIIELKQKDHYELALNHARRLVSDFPLEPRAEVIFNEILELAHRQRQLTTDEQMAELQKEISERIRRALVPSGFDGKPIFSPDFIHLDRQNAGWDAEVEVPEWQIDLLDSLQDRTSVNWDGTPILEALEFIKKKHDLNLVWGPDVAADNTPVTLQGRNMRLESVFDWICMQAGTRWSLRNEAIYVGEDTTETPVFRVYDISAMLQRPPDMPGANSLGLLSAASGGGGLSMSNIVDNRDAEGEVIDPEDLVDLIQTVVAPGEWDNEAYGIQVRNNLMMVTVAPRIHVLLSQFMDGLRNINNQLASIDVRWVEVEDSYIEEIGVDWANNGGVLSQAPFSPGYQQERREWSGALSSINVLPDNAATAERTEFQGLNLQWVHMNRAQVSAMFTAIHKKRKGRELNSINMTIINGVRGNAFFGFQTSYVSGYAVSGNGNFEPELDVVGVGQSLDVRPFISADRKYVTLDIRPILVDVNFFTERISTVRNNNALVSITEYPIELPNFRVYEAGTSVMIPDKGSILVGGFGGYRRQYSKSQVPFLGHLPFLGRLFSKRGRYDERYRLYLTLSARIILYEEEEAML